MDMYYLWLLVKMVSELVFNVDGDIFPHQKYPEGVLYQTVLLNGGALIYPGQKIILPTG